MKQFRDNQYDFKHFEKKKFSDIRFVCPKIFQLYKGPAFTFKKGGLSLVNVQMGIYMTIEKFTTTEAEKFLMYYEEDIYDKLLATHDQYVQKRIASLEYCENSIRIDLPEGSKFLGSMEMIVGKNDNIFEDLTYKIATLQKGDSFYVFQFITGSELAAYTNDDFDKILKSVR